MRKFSFAIYIITNHGKQTSPQINRKDSERII